MPPATEAAPVGRDILPAPLASPRGGPAGVYRRGVSDFPLARTQPAFTPIRPPPWHEPPLS